MKQDVSFLYGILEKMQIIKQINRDCNNDVNCNETVFEKIFPFACNLLTKKNLPADNSISFSFDFKFVWIDIQGILFIFYIQDFKQSN